MSLVENVMGELVVFDAAICAEPVGEKGAC